MIHTQNRYPYLRVCVCVYIDQLAINNLNKGVRDTMKSVVKVEGRYGPEFL